MVTRPLVAATALALGLSLGLPTPSAGSPIIQDFSNEARNIAPWAGQSFTAEDALIDVVGVYVVDFTIGSVATDTTVEYSLYGAHPTFDGYPCMVRSAGICQERAHGES
jgi:hypothetical protein